MAPRRRYMPLERFEHNGNNLYQDVHPERMVLSDLKTAMDHGTERVLKLTNL